MIRSWYAFMRSSIIINIGLSLKNSFQKDLTQIANIFLLLMGKEGQHLPLTHLQEDTGCVQVKLLVRYLLSSSFQEYSANMTLNSLTKSRWRRNQWLTLMLQRFLLLWVSGKETIFFDKSFCWMILKNLLWWFDF